MKVNVSCVQMKPELYEVDKNIEKMCGFIDKAMKENSDTDLIIFPELITTGYECGERFQEFAETIPDGKSLRIIREYAAKYNVHIIYGFPERDPFVKDVLYNAAVFIGNDGEVIGGYRKVHPFADEKKWCRAGCEYPLYDTSIGKIGIMICWDTGFPEVARTYGLKGADLLVVCTNWEKPYSDDWDLITGARAFDNTTYLAAANRIGHDPVLGFFGHSRIVDPVGKPIVKLDEEVEGIISAELDYDLSLKLKHECYTFNKDRRPDTFEELVRKY